MPKAKRIGRPPLKKYDRKIVVTFRFTPAEKWLIQRAAEERGEKLSEWIRASLIATAEVELFYQVEEAATTIQRHGSCS